MSPRRPERSDRSLGSLDPDLPPRAGENPGTANLRTKILDFGGFDSSRILILRGGIPRPIENPPEV